MWIYTWLAVTVIALVIEFTTNEMVSIWFAGGGIVALILSACGVPWAITMPVFLVLSFALLISFRKIVMKYFSKGDSRVNADSAIGKEYTLLTAIEFNKPGTININDVVWNVTTETQGATIPEGTIVRVLSLKGNKYIVEQV